MANLGQLERAVMDIIWDAPAALTAYDILPRLEAAQPKPLAVTTVLTVLSRLEKKGLVRSDRTARPHRYRPVASRAEHIAELMHEVLGDTRDRTAVLERFVDGVSPDDAALLRRLLDGTR